MANRYLTTTAIALATFLLASPAAAQDNSTICNGINNCERQFITGHQDFSVEKSEGSVSVDVDAPGLAALAPSDCVLSETHSGGFSIGVPGAVGVGASYGQGRTTPYDECNEREAIKVVAQIDGEIDGVPTSRIVAEMVKHLTGVQAAIDRANGIEPQTSEVVAEVQEAQRPTVYYGSNR